MPESNRKQLGTRGEQLVARHLERLGWRVLQTNFRCWQGEIDVVAEEPGKDGRDDKTLVFIEVKTRHGKAYGAPIEAVDPRKQRRLWNVAQAYLGTLDAGGEEPACRFDIAEVFIDVNDLASIALRRACLVEE